MIFRIVTALSAVLALSGCSFYARGADDYRKAVRNLLDTRTDQVETCYRRELKENDGAKGKVVVRFEVEPKTGEFDDVKVVEGDTTANKRLQKCVLESLEGLKLDPPDERMGKAEFTWDFSR